MFNLNTYESSASIFTVSFLVPFISFSSKRAIIQKANAMINASLIANRKGKVNAFFRVASQLLSFVRYDSS